MIPGCNAVSTTDLSSIFNPRSIWASDVGKLVKFVCPGIVRCSIQLPPGHNLKVCHRNNLGGDVPVSSGSEIYTKQGNELTGLIDEFSKRVVNTNRLKSFPEPVAPNKHATSHSRPRSHDDERPSSCSFTMRGLVGSAHEGYPI